jgi:hypothetical protein
MFDYLKKFADTDGYVLYDEEANTAELFSDKLREICEDESCDELLRAAAAIELSCRALARWRVGD